MNRTIPWPEGKQFAFSVFDDTDFATLENVRAVYALLTNHGFRTTKSVWPIKGDKDPVCGGATAHDADYLAWLLALQETGFEIGYHMATFHTSVREESRRGLEIFASLFGHDPKSMANHVGCEENIYWGNYRLTGKNEIIYNLLTRNRNKGKYRGHVEKDKHFWGDLCREHITYVRNFVFADINTLKRCPTMPYHDPLRPYVNYWFASSDGAGVHRFNRCIAERHQDRLEAEGGACIMYTHFGAGFFEDGRLNEQFRHLIERLSKKNGWFVPVSTLLDYILKTRGRHVITDAERQRLERRWLVDKVRLGTT